MIPILPLDMDEEADHSHLHLSHPPQPAQPKPSPPPAPAPAPAQEQDEDQEEEEDEKHRVWELFSDEYHDIVTELPLEFQRNFHLIRELEDSQQSSTRQLQFLLQSYITSLAPRSSTPVAALEGGLETEMTSAKERLEMISRTARSAIRAGEDKVGLAVTLYESVDRHIRRLDASLSSTSDTLLLGLRAGTLPSNDAPHAGPSHQAGGSTTSLGVGAAAGAGMGMGEVGDKKKETKTEKRQRERKKKREERRRAALAGSTSASAAVGAGAGGGVGGGGVAMKGKMKSGKKAGRPPAVGGGPAGKGAGGAGGGAGKPHVPSHFVETVEMAFDPTEPTYCYCDRVSFGDMIGCENEDCPREWFHMECVGLSAAPSGVWFCRDCRPK